MIYQLANHLIMSIIDKIDELAEKKVEISVNKDDEFESKALAREMNFEVHAFTKDVAGVIRLYFRSRGMEYSETYHFRTYHFNFSTDVFGFTEFRDWVEENEIAVNY